MSKADEILEKFEQMNNSEAGYVMNNGPYAEVPVTLRADDNHPLATIADPGRVKICANFKEGTCYIDCDHEGVKAGTLCPFIPLIRHPQCACYEAGEYVT